MGISGLIPFMKKASREINVSYFRGQTVAVDAYCWLHKGAFSCAEKLVKGEPTDGYVHYVLKMVNMLLGAGVTPILVFDGQNLPSKRQTELKRRENREKNRKKAKELLREGKVREARECFQRCIDITPQMAREVILACRTKGVDCLVAPYEADAQLAYLSKAGIVQLVITEDSDLIPFGCEKVLFKMDHGGHGILVEQSRLYLCLGLKAESFTFEKFRRTCILSGCDYLESLPGIGLAKATKFFSLTTNPNLHQALSRIPSYLRMPKLVVSTEYKDAFIQAENTFLYQVVFCPLRRKLVPLHPYPSDLDVDLLTYAGKFFSNDLAKELAKGNINVSSLKRFPDSEESKKPCSGTRHQSLAATNGSESIWSSNYEIKDKSIQHCTKPTKIPATCDLKFKPKKRKLEPTEAVILGPNDDELLSLYGSVDSKADSPPSSSPAGRDDPLERSPLSQINCKPSSSPLRDTKTKTPIRNRFFIPKSPGELQSPSPVVRSRFFWKSPGTAVKDKPTSSFWDKLEEQVPTENIPPTRTNGSVMFSKSWPKSTSNNLTSSPKVLEPFRPTKFSDVNDSRTSKLQSPQNEFSSPSQTLGPSQVVNVDSDSEDPLCFKSDSYEQTEILTNNLRSSFSQSSDNEEPIIIGNTVSLSQLTVCSIDRESFGGSQDSQDVAPQVNSNTRAQTPKTKVKISRKGPSCRRVGLSKKGPTISSGQLSLKEAFEKYRFVK